MIFKTTSYFEHLLLSDPFYYFTYAAEPKCDILAKGCFMKTNIKAEIISKDIIKVSDSYYCSEDHIKEVNNAKPKLFPTRGDGYMDYGYGNCTKVDG